MFDFLIDVGLAVWGILGLLIAAAAAWLFVVWVRIPRVQCDTCKRIVYRRNVLLRPPSLQVCVPCAVSFDEELRKRLPPAILAQLCDACRELVKEEGGLIRMVNGMRICAKCAEASRRPRGE